MTFTVHPLDRYRSTQCVRCCGIQGHFNPMKASKKEYNGNTPQLPDPIFYCLMPIRYNVSCRTSRGVLCGSETLYLIDMDKQKIGPGKHALKILPKKKLVK